jgi:hypothetical protein
MGHTETLTQKKKIRKKLVAGSQPVIPMRLKHKDQEFKASLGYTETPWLKKNKKDC